jgi:hypothetical protein
MKDCAESMYGQTRSKMGRKWIRQKCRRVIPALNRNTAGTVIIDDDSERSAKYAQEAEEENE